MEGHIGSAMGEAKSRTRENTDLGLSIGRNFEVVKTLFTGGFMQQIAASPVIPSKNL
jgi:hypothetical protein